MKKSMINKRIRKIERRYYDACDKVNKDHTRIEKEIDLFRIRSVQEILRLKDKELIKLYETKCVKHKEKVNKK